MTVTLSYLSTLNEVLDCEDARLRQEIGFLNQEVVTEYIFHLRAELRARDEVIIILKGANEGGSGGGYENVGENENVASKLDSNPDVQLKLDRNYAEVKALREEVQRSFGEMFKHQDRSIESKPGPSSTGPSVVTFEFSSSNVFLQGYHENYFVSAQPDGSVECNREQPLSWEQITIERHSKNIIYLKSCHGKYLSAEPDGTLLWSSDKKGPWEQFEVHMVVAEHRIALRCHHGQWVSAQPDGSICADRVVLNTWECFTVKHLPNWADPKPGFEFPSKKVYLQGHKGYFVCAERGGKAACSNSTSYKDWQAITIMRHYGNWIYLQYSNKFKRYLSAQTQGTLLWKQEEYDMGPCEQFEVYTVDGNKLGLKSCHGKWVSAQPDGSLCADRAELNTWECFTVIPV